MDNWRKVPWLAIEAAKREIDELTSRLDHESDLRKRVKSARRLAFVGSSLAFSNEPLDIATIDAGITALSKARRFGAVTDDLNRSVAMLTQLKLEATGRSGFKVLAEKKKVVAVNAACLAAAGRKELDPNA